MRSERARMLCEGGSGDPVERLAGQTCERQLSLARVISGAENKPRFADMALRRRLHQGQLIAGALRMLANPIRP